MSNIGPQHFSHKCATCDDLITGVGEKEFEAKWEAHKAEHVRDAERLGGEISVPTAEELNAAATKAKATTAGLQAMYKNDADHTRDIEKHFDGVSRIERRLPQLIDFAFKLANAIGAWAKEKDYRVKSLKLGNIYWTPAGDIAAEFEYDKYNIVTEPAPEYLKRGFVRLPQLQAHHPAAFELCMTLGEHLCNIIDMRRATPKDIGFTNLHHFTNPNTNTENWSFRITNHRAIMKAQRAHL